LKLIIKLRLNRSKPVRETEAGTFSALKISTIGIQLDLLI